MESATPRVNKNLLPNYVGHVVRCVGKRLSVDPSSGTGVIDTGDGTISVRLNLNTTWEQLGSRYIEIVGTVLDNQMVDEMACYAFGDNFGKFELTNISFK